MRRALWGWRSSRSTSRHLRLPSTYCDLGNVGVQLLAVAGPAHGHPGIARAHRRLVVRRNRKQVRFHVDQQFLGIGQFCLVDRIERIAVIVQRSCRSWSADSHAPSCGPRSRPLSGQRTPSSCQCALPPCVLVFTAIPRRAPVLWHRIKHTIDGARIRKARIKGAGVIVRQFATDRAARSGLLPT